MSEEKSWQEVPDNILESMNFNKRFQKENALNNEIERVKKIVLNQADTEFVKDIWQNAIFLLRKIGFFLWNTINKFSIDSLPNITVDEDGSIDVNWDTASFELIYSINKNKNIIDIYAKSLENEIDIPLEYLGPFVSAEAIIITWLRKIL